MLSDGQAQDYNGNRKAADFASFAKKFAGPAFVEITTEEEYKTFVAENLAVVGVFEAESKGGWCERFFNYYYYYFIFEIF